MRFSDAAKPAMSWEEAALTPAQVRTLSGGAALKTVKMRADTYPEAMTESMDEAKEAALPKMQSERPAAPLRPSAARGMGRAALMEVLRRTRR